MIKKKKPPSSKQYREAEMGILQRFAPDIYACKKCAWPVADGYCCQYCGDSNPSEPADSAAPGDSK